MRKIYSLAVVSALAFTAAAGNGLSFRAGVSPVCPDKVNVPVFEAGIGEVNVAGPARVQARAEEQSPRKLQGDYIISIGDYYRGDAGKGLFTEAAYILLEEDNSVKIGCEYFPTDVPAVFDPATGVLGFKSVALGLFKIQGKDYYVRFEPVAVNNTTNQLEAKNYDATFNSTTGNIAFPSRHGFSWLAYSDANYTTPVAYVDAFDVEGMEKDGDEADPNEGWTSIGNGIFQDGWLLPAVGINQEDSANWYAVEVQQKDDDQHVYRIVNPYKGASPVAPINSCLKNGYIEFDVNDPNHVSFAHVNAGFANKDAGIKEFYCYNLLTYYAAYYEVSVPELLQGLTQEIPFTTFHDNVVTLSTDIEDGTYSNDACFGTQDKPFGSSVWTDQQGKPVNMSCRIFLPGSEVAAGVNTLLTDASDEAVFYNLQGVRVAEPHGITVVVSGGKARKVIFP